MAAKNPIDIYGELRGTLPDECSFSESGSGQIPNPISRGLPGSNGYHSVANTFTIIGNIGGMEISWEVSGENFDRYTREVSGLLSKEEKNRLIFKFLRKNQLPYQIRKWPDRG